MDAVAACIAMEELSYSDPAFCLSYLAHSMLFVNNLAVNGSKSQLEQYLPDVCSGKKIGGMCMSEPGAGTDVSSNPFLLLIDICVRVFHVCVICIR